MWDHYKHKCTRFIFPGYISTLQVESWDQMEDLVSLLTNHHLFSKASGPFYKPTSNIRGFQFLHVIISCSSSSNENGVKFHCGFNLWFLQWLLTLSIFSPAYWPFAYFLWRNTYSNILPFFETFDFINIGIENTR